MDIQERALEIFRETGVLHEGHFCLTSGRHSNRYMQCGRVFEQADKAAVLCGALADLFRDDQVQAVVGPALGAMLMAYEVSRHLNCRNMFTERENGVMTFRRGFTLSPGLRVLVVEDAITTGGTVREVLSLCNQQGAHIVGVGGLVDRSGGAIDFGVPFRAVVTARIESWTAEECPLCKEGIACVKPGSRTRP